MPQQPPGRRDSGGSRTAGWSHAAALCWFGLLAIGVSWPLLLQLDTHIPGSGAGDNVAFLWNFWWFRYAAGDPEASIFFTRHLFAPFGTSLVLHTHTALEAAVGATVLGAAPVVAAHNIVLLAGLGANGAAVYALAHHHVRRAFPAVLAGTVFAASAYISIRLRGHFNLVHAWVLPLALLTWMRCLEKPTLVRGAALAAAFAAAAYTDYYYVVYAAMAAVIWWAIARWDIRVVRARRQTGIVPAVLLALMLGLVVLIAAILATGGFRFEIGSVRISASNIRNPVAGVWLLAIAWLALRVRLVVQRSPEDLSDGGGRGLRHPLVAALAIAIVLWLAALLPLASAAADLFSSGDYVAPARVWRSGPRGIDLLTLIAGNPLNAIYGGITRAMYSRADIDLMEQSAWVGIVPLVVLTIALVRGSLRNRVARPWLIVTLVFLIWAMGGYVLAGGIETGLPMPQILARFVPILSNARMPGRAMVMVQLGVAILCAIAVTRFDWRRSVLIGLIALGVADGAAAPIQTYEIPRAGPIESALAAAGPDSAVAELPTGLRDGFGEAGRFDHRALIFQMFHERPLAGGFVARLPPRVGQAYSEVPVLSALVAVSSATRAEDVSALPDDLAGGLLAAGITHVIVNTGSMRFSVREALESRGFRLIVEAGGRELYAAGGGS